MRIVRRNEVDDPRIIEGESNDQLEIYLRRMEEEVAYRLHHALRQA